MMKKAKIAILLVLALVFAVQGIGMGTAQAARVVWTKDQVTKANLIEGLGLAANSGVLTKEFEQVSHSESNVIADKVFHEPKQPMLVSGRGNAAMGYNLLASVELPIYHLADEMTFRVYTYEDGEYKKTSMVETVNVAGLTEVEIDFGKVTDKNLYSKNLYVFQEENGVRVPDSGVNADKLEIEYGDPISGNDGGYVYIGSLQYKPGKDTEDVCQIFQGPNEWLGPNGEKGYISDLHFGPSVKLYKKVGDTYTELDDEAKEVLDKVYIRDSHWKKDLYQELKNVTNDGTSFVLYGEHKFNVEYENDEKKVEKLLATMKDFSWSLANSELGLGGTLADGIHVGDKPKATGNGTHMGTLTDGAVVTLYHIEASNGVVDQSVLKVVDSELNENNKSKIDDDGLPIADNEYVVFNVVVPAGVKTVDFTDTKIGYKTSSGQNQHADAWGDGGGVDAMSRVIWNVIQETPDGKYEPFIGEVINGQKQGGVLLAPAATVQVKNTANAMNIVGEKVIQHTGIELHQLSFNSATTKLRMTNNPSVDVVGTKKWVDCGFYCYHDSVTVILNADGEPIMKKTFYKDRNTSWTDFRWSFEGLPKLAEDGHEIEYTITEQGMPGYEVSVDGFNITNTHKDNKTAVNGNKIWDDDDDRDNLRPDRITVTLQRRTGTWKSNGYGGSVQWNDDWTDVKEKTVSKATNWEFSFGDLNSHSDGYTTWYDYRVVEKVEDIPEGYTPSGTPIEENGEIIGYAFAGQGAYPGYPGVFYVTNKHDIETVDVTGTKNWNDKNYPNRPQEITVRLFADGFDTGMFKKVSADSEGNWTWSFTDLPKNENGKRIIYTVKEDEVRTTDNTIGYSPDYSHSTDNDGNVSAVITNTIKTTIVAGTKTWNNLGYDNLQPETVKFDIYRIVMDAGEGENDPSNDVHVQTITAKRSENYSWSVELPTYDGDGNELSYRVEEQKVQGYESQEPTVTQTTEGGKNKHQFAFVNTLETVSVSGTKTWDDEQNKYNTRPQEIRLYLQQSTDGTNWEKAQKNHGDVVTSVRVQGDSQEWSFSGLPKYDAESNKEYQYRVVEETVNGYKTVYENKQGISDTEGVHDGGKMQNTLAGTEVPLAVKKQLNGEDYTGSDFTFKLQQVNEQGQPVQGVDAVTVSEVENGIVSFPALKFNRGTMMGPYGQEYYKQFRYIITEVAGSASNVQYDPTEFKVEIVAQFIGDQLVVSEPKYYKINPADGSAAEQKEITFANTSTVTATGGLTLTKVDAADNAIKLSGAVFTVYSDTSWSDSSIVGTMTESTAEAGVYTLSGLTVGTTYYVKETQAPDTHQLPADTYYTVTVTGDNTPVQTGVVTNAVKTVSVSVNKEWVHTGNPASVLPTSATVQLYADDQEMTDAEYTKTITGGTAVQWDDLPKYRYDDNKKQWEEIIYTVKEKDVPNDYKVSVTGGNGEFTITNTYQQKLEVIIPVSKRVAPEGAAENEVFTFEMEPFASSPPMAMPTDAKTDENGRLYATASVTGAGETAFTRVVFTYDQIADRMSYPGEEQEFAWLVTEVEGSNPDIAYDTSTAYCYVVFIGIDENGKMYFAKQEDGTMAEIRLSTPEEFRDKTIDAKYVKAEKIEFNNTLVETSVRLEATKQLNASLSDGQFGFSLTDKNGGNKSHTAYNDASGKVTFNEMKYTLSDMRKTDGTIAEQKTFYYWIQEGHKGDVKTENGKYVYDGIVYDNSQYTAVVTVTYDATTHTLTPEVKYYPGQHDGNSTLPNEVAAPSFTNTKVGTDKVSFAAKKMVNGTLNGNGEYTFKLMGYKLPETGKTATNGEGGVVSFADAVEFTLEDMVETEGEGENAVKKIADEKTFNYTIEEVNDGVDGVTYDATKYNVAVTVKFDEATGALRVQDPVYTKVGETTGTTTDPVFYNQVNASTTVTFEAYKKLDGQLVTEKGKFSFMLDCTELGIKKAAGNGADGKVSFPTVTIDLEDMKDNDGNIILSKSFQFSIEEGKPGAAVPVDGKYIHNGVVYDNTIYIAVVTVTYDPTTNKLTAADPVYYQDYDPESTENEAIAPEAVVFNNTTVGTTKVSFQATKNLNGQACTEANFSFKVTGPKLETTGITASNDAEGNVSFVDAVKFTLDDLKENNVIKSPKTFEYTIEEVVPDGATENTDGSYTYLGVVYDKTKYTAVVTLTYADLKLTSDVKYYDSEEYRTAKDAGIVPNAVDAVFNNQTDKPDAFETSFLVWKHFDIVGGGQVSSETRDKLPKEFSFEVTLQKDDQDKGEIAGSPFKVAVDITTGESKKIPVTFTEPGKYVYTVKEVANAADTVIYDDSTFTVEYNVTEELDGNKVVLQVSKPIIKKDGTPVEGNVSFTNRYGEAGIDLKAKKEINADKGPFAFVLKDANGKVLDQQEGIWQNGSVSFAELRFSTADVKNETPVNGVRTKTYSYTISEVIPEGATAENGYTLEGITYDPTEYPVSVTVTFDENATENVDKLTVTADYGEDESGADKSEVVITNKYAVTGSTTLAVEKILEGRDFQEGDSFTFKLTASEGAPMPAEGGDEIVLAWTDGAMVSTGTFGLINFTQEHVGNPNPYIYTVTETADIDGVVNDSKTHTVEVTVVDNGDGTLSIDKTYKNGDDEGDKLIFVNEYKTGTATANLAVTKQLLDSNDKELSLADGQFSFTLTEKGKTDALQTKSNVAGNVTFETITYDKAGTYEYVIAEVKGEDANIVYSTKEVAVTVVVSDDGKGKLTAAVTYDRSENEPVFINTKPETEVEFTATKEFVDSNGNAIALADGQFSFTLTKMGEDEPLQTATNDADGNIAFDAIKYTLADMADATEADGKLYKEINYVIAEVVPDENPTADGITYDTNEYAVTAVLVYDEETNTLTATAAYVGEDEANPPVFTNTKQAEEEKTSITVTKKWEDNNNDKQKRPASVTVYLVVDDVKQPVGVVLSDANDWTYTWTELETSNENGDEINYWVEEDVVPFYFPVVTYDEENSNGLILTNRYEDTFLNVKKVWEGDENAIQDRPESVTVYLVIDGEKQSEGVVLSKDNDWTYVWPRLPIYNADDNEIKYSVEEDAVSGYQTEYVQGVVNPRYWNVVNTYEAVEEKSYSVELEKADKLDSSKKLEGAEYTLYTKETCTEEDILVLPDGTKAIITTDANGLGTLTNVPAGTYWVKETGAPDGYQVDPEAYPITVPNATNPDEPVKVQVKDYPETSVAVKKVWEGVAEDADLPEITVQLKADGNAVEGKTLKLNAACNWAGEFTELDSYDELTDEPITYTVEEIAVDGYDTVITGDAEDGFTITNTKKAEEEKTSIKVTKVWDDNNDAAQARPEKIVVKLLVGAGNLYEEVTLDETNNWTHTWEDLPAKNSQDKAYSYTVEEVTVDEDGQPLDWALLYTAKVTGSMVEGFTITNTKQAEEEEKTSIKVTKVWAGDEEALEERPESVSVYLVVNGTKQDTAVVLSEDNSWTHTWTELPVKADGQIITYTVEEKLVPGYADAVTGDAANGFTITNTLAKGDFEMEFTKSLVGGAELPEGETRTFTFKLYEFDNDVKGAEAGSTTITLPYNGSVEDVLGSITFDIKYGEHYYLLEEVPGEDADITYDSQKYKLMYYALVDRMPNGEQTGELVMEDYAWEYYPAKEDGAKPEKLHFTNTYEAPEKTSITVTKVWEDNNNAAGVRPEFIQVVLSMGGGRPPVGGIKVLNADNNWTYTWEDLNVYDGSGNRLEYTVIEKIPGDAAEYYVGTTTATENGFILTNTYVAEEKLGLLKLCKSDRLNPNKKLEGAQYTLFTQETCKEEEILVLPDGTKAIITTGADGWGTLTGVPSGTYWVKETKAPVGYEVDPEPYKVEVKAEAEEPVQVQVSDFPLRGALSLSKTVVTNGETDESFLFDIELSRTDSDPIAGSYEATLNGVATDKVTFVAEGKTAKATVALKDGETLVIHGLRAGTTYLVSEQPNERYDVQINGVAATSAVGTISDTALSVAKFQNTLKLVGFTVKKEWTGLAEGETTPAIKLTLYCNGKAYPAVTPAPDKNGWYTYTGLPAYVDGKLAVYTVKEEPVTGFTTTYLNKGENAAVTDCAHNGSTIVNSKIPQTGDTTPLALWMLTSLLAAFGLLGVTAKLRKREN